VTITPGFAAELGPLRQALDLTGMGVADTPTRLASDAQTAVDSYLGLPVAINASRSRLVAARPGLRTPSEPTIGCSLR
jgi:hypothetical protein